MEQTVATFYQFANLPDCINWQRKLRTHCKKFNVLGTVILAEEGINGTVSSSAEGIKEILAFIKKDERFSQMPYRISTTPRKTFYRIRVVVRKEIVTLGDATINPNDKVGTYVEPKNWNKIIQDPDTVVIDTRNDYEAEIGAFSGAINPQTKTFRDFPKFVEENLDPSKNKKVAMYCTGGIRCEKASAYYKHKGFKNVFQLEGGIINYVRQVESHNLENKFLGKNFVFDERRSERISDDVIALVSTSFDDTL